MLQANSLSVRALVHKKRVIAAIKRRRTRRIKRVRRVKNITETGATLLPLKHLQPAIAKTTVIVSLKLPALSVQPLPLASQYLPKSTKS
jgi:hypothetical protein